MSLRERLIDFAVPEKAFKRELNREIEDCLAYFNDPYLVKGIGITVGRYGRSGRKGEFLDLAKRDPRGYFWEKNGVRHMVGQEVMTRQQKDNIIKAIHHITFPYAEHVANKR